MSNEPTNLCLLVSRSCHSLHTIRMKSHEISLALLGKGHVTSKLITEHPVYNVFIANTNAIQPTIYVYVIHWHCNANQVFNYSKIL